MRRVPPGGWRALAAVLCVLLLAACGEGERTAPLARPAGYHPERFPDIPLPAGFAPASDHDQLAVVIAGGQIRRFDVALIAKTTAKGGEADAGRALTRWRETLPGLGWELVAAGHDQQRWRRRNATRVGEELTIDAGSSGGKATLRLRIAPLAQR